MAYRPAPSGRLLVAALIFLIAADLGAEPLGPGTPVRGWTILSNSEPDAMAVIAGGSIDLDNPKFWDWFKADYRALLDLSPRADGVVLTIIETGARVERQHSTRLPTAQDKLADFFLTHPNDFFAGTIARPTLIEFDTGAEYSGQDP